jgi:thiamine-monophosphate kinase
LHGFYEQQKWKNLDNKMADHSRPGEFDLIKKYLRPLASDESGAASLSDDAAVLPTKDGHRLVVTMDTLISGVHFFEFTPPHFIAAKSLRVNLSDLASMGADPAYYTLSLSLPLHGEVKCDADWLYSFTQALAIEQNLFDITLVGGDTVSTPGPLSLTITAFGWVKIGQEIMRSGARAGDLIYVSGTIGDAWLGLSALQGGHPELEPSSLELITESYHQPQPRLDLGCRLFGVANSAIDISDGLAQDLGHICRASNVSATINSDEVPLSGPARMLLEGDAHLINGLLSGGDDYELLFTVPPEWQKTVADIAKELNLPLSRIGLIEPSEQDHLVTIIDKVGTIMNLASTGYRHF